MLYIIESNKELAAVILWIEIDYFLIGHYVNVEYILNVAILGVHLILNQMKIAFDWQIFQVL